MAPGDLHVTTFDSALGPCAVASTTAGLVATTVPGDEGVARLRAWAAARADGEPFEGLGRNAEAVAVISAWLAGERTDFGDLPLVVEGTPFQRAIWDALREVPYAHTVSYAELAARAGHPTAARACGAANGSNRLPLVIPCHRVVAADGGLGGFGGGRAAKQALLDLERRVAHARGLPRTPSTGHLFM